MKYTQQYINTECHKFVKAVIAFIETEYKYHLSNLNVKLDWGKNRTRSWGGIRGNTPFISISMLRYFKSDCSEDNLAVFTEYASFAKEADIGSIVADDLMLIYKGIISHEIAHAIANDLHKKEAHGPNWKKWYRRIRNEFVNPYIKKELQILTPKVNEDIMKDKANNYLNNAALNGMKKEWLNKYFLFGDKQYKIIGWNTRARKYPVETLCATNGKIYVFPIADVKSRMEYR